MESLNPIKIETQPLDILLVPEVVYVPLQPGNKGGLFHVDGTPIQPAVNHRGQGITISSNLGDIDINSLPTIEGTFFYVGQINRHYGHFLVESTTRLWPLLHLHKGFSGKFLCFGAASLSDETCYIHEILTACRLDHKKFISYPKPCKIRNVYVPSPSFEIRLRAHILFRETMLHIGRSLISDIDSISNSNPSPLYLSKSRLKTGGTGIANETAIEAALRRMGVDVLYPETLGLTDQIRELASRQYLLGTVGSALHTLLFCPGGKTISGVHFLKNMNSTFTMIDQLCGNIGHYKSGTDMGFTMANEQPADATDPAGFRRLFHARHPDDVAKGLLALADNIAY